MNSVNRGIVLACIVCVTMLMACGSGKYGDAGEIIAGQAEITEKYVDGLGKAKSADEVVVVIDEFTKGMKTLIPEIKKYQSKYPELWAGKGGIPQEIKANQERLQAASAKVESAALTLVQYMMDAKVQQAMTSMGQELKQLQ